MHELSKNIMVPKISNFHYRGLKELKYTVVCYFQGFYSVVWQFGGTSAFHMVVLWHKLDEVENECISHSFSLLAIFLPKIIKFGGNFTKFWQIQFCLVFWDTVCLFQKVSLITKEPMESWPEDFELCIQCRLPLLSHGRWLFSNHNTNLSFSTCKLLPLSELHTDIRTTASMWCQYLQKKSSRNFLKVHLFSYRNISNQCFIFWQHLSNYYFLFVFGSINFDLTSTHSS